MFLLAFVFWGMTAALPGYVEAQGPMIAQDEASAREGDGAKPPLFLALDPGGPVGSAGGNPGGPMIAGENPEGPELSGSEGSPGPDLKTDKADEWMDPVDLPEGQEGLYKEVRELRDIVERLRDEAQARDHLRVTAEEERDEQEEILEAAGREYSLRPPWTFNMDLNVQYSYNSYDIIRYLDMVEGRSPEYHSNHNIDNSLSFESGVRDNLAVSATVPFVYNYDAVDTAQSRSVTGLGDISLGLKYQPLKTGKGYPSPIFSISYGLPTGKSPYDINPDTELSTGSGLKRVSGGVSVSQPFDPVSAFASLSYSHRFRETGIGQLRGNRTLEEVDPGASISGSLGFGYAISYRVSMSLSLSYSYGYSSDYYWTVIDRLTGQPGTEKTESGDSVSASLGLTTAWRITPSRTIIIGIGKGLTTANPGFSISTRIPVSFDWR
jgi:hypothetical protein